MKKYIEVSLLLFVPISVCGQEIPDVNNASPTSPPIWQEEFDKAVQSNYVDAFIEAFYDPNVLIGVFEGPERSVSTFSQTALSSGEILESLPGYREGLGFIVCINSVISNLSRANFQSRWFL